MYFFKPNLKLVSKLNMVYLRKNNIVVKLVRVILAVTYRTPGHPHRLKMRRNPGPKWSEGNVFKTLNTGWSNKGLIRTFTCSEPWSDPNGIRSLNTVKCGHMWPTWKCCLSPYVDKMWLKAHNFNPSKNHWSLFLTRTRRAAIQHPEK